jgi:hypothetical protein
MARKRHHYVPKAYLKFFCAADGKLHVYLKDEPGRSFQQAPDATAFHKYYYSQPLPHVRKDHDALENFFSALEAKWPPLVERMQRRVNINDALDDVFQFVALQRARVPALRDAAERTTAATLKSTLLQLDAMGKLPPKPEGRPDIREHVEFAIDPHHSIHSMPTFLRAMGTVLDRVGLGILHNVTDVPFITSDNPVVYFDPRTSEEELLPYTLDRAGGPVVLCFPIAPRLMLYGHSSMRERFSYEGLRHSDMVKEELVEHMNRQTSRFAYRAVFANRTGFEDLVRQHAHESPIVKTTIVRQGTGTLVAHQAVFGKRQVKPKWEGSA